MRGFSTRRSGLRIQIERCNGAHDQVARVALIHLAGIDGKFAGLHGAIACEIDNVLLCIDAEIIIRERPYHLWNRKTGKGKSLGLQIVILIIGIRLCIHARQQRSREAALARAFRLVNLCAGG